MESLYAIGIVIVVFLSMTGITVNVAGSPITITAGLLGTVVFEWLRKKVAARP